MKKKREPVVEAKISAEGEAKCAELLGLVFVQGQMLFQTIDNYSDVLERFFLPNATLTKTIYRIKANTRGLKDFATEGLTEAEMEALYDDSSAVWRAHIEPLIAAIQKSRKK